MAEKIFGVSLTNSDGRIVPVRYVGEQHVQEDLGHIPTLADWFRKISPEPWMLGRGKDLEKELNDADVKKSAKRR